MSGANQPRYVYIPDCSLYLNMCDIILVDINECLSNPCVNGTICTDAVDAYTCACVAGYTGPQCETGEFMGLKNSYNYLYIELRRLRD